MTGARGSMYSMEIYVLEALDEHMADEHGARIGLQTMKGRFALRINARFYCSAAGVLRSLHT